MVVVVGGASPGMKHIYRSFCSICPIDSKLPCSPTKVRYKSTKVWCFCAVTPVGQPSNRLTNSPYYRVMAHDINGSSFRLSLFLFLQVLQQLVHYQVVVEEEEEEELLQKDSQEDLPQLPLKLLVPKGLLLFYATAALMTSSWCSLCFWSFVVWLSKVKTFYW